MKNIILIVLATITVGVTMNSCKKKGCTNELAINYDDKAKKDDDSCEYGDTTRPVITINDPSKDMYMLDMTTMTVRVPISVSISDNDGLHSVAIALTNTTAEEEVLHIHLHPDSKTATVDTFYTATKGHQDYELSIVAEDHNENEAKATANTHVHMM